VQAIKDAMPRVVADIVRAAPLSPAKVAFAWRLAVGPAVDRNTTIHLDQGTLIVEAATQQWAEEVRRSVRVIVGRMRSMLGTEALARLDVRIRPLA
jgi:Dna[CI] antecedent, DciA